ncbi:hypothetical protein ACTNES_16985, partial [Blautia sp. HCP3S3_D9]|uniref:hypothetical protein n=1 Tax=Blautia sp. HCP3S3_D9 TaxID=3438912 RepID=UPI003F8A6F96
NFNIMMPPFVVFPTNRIAHFVEVSLYLFYLAQQVNLIQPHKFAPYVSGFWHIHVKTPRGIVACEQ